MTPLEVFKTRRMFVIGRLRDGIFTIPVRGDPPTSRSGADLDKLSLSGAMVFSTEHAARAAIRRIEG